MALRADVSVYLRLCRAGLVSVSAGALYGGRGVHWMDVGFHVVPLIGIVGQPLNIAESGRLNNSTMLAILTMPPVTLAKISASEAEIPGPRVADPC